VREAYSLYAQSNKLDLLIKFTLTVAELYEVMGKYEQAAN